MLLLEKVFIVQWIYWNYFYQINIIIDVHKNYSQVKNYNPNDNLVWAYSGNNN